MASGRAPRIGRKRPPTIPGPRISNKSSLPVDRKVAALNIINPYTITRNRFPSTVVVQGRKPYVCSQDSSAMSLDLTMLRGRRRKGEGWSPLLLVMPSEIKGVSSEIRRLWAPQAKKRRRRRGARRSGDHDGCAALMAIGGRRMLKSVRNSGLYLSTTFPSKGHFITDAFPTNFIIRGNVWRTIKDILELFLKKNVWHTKIKGLNFEKFTFNPKSFNTFYIDVLIFEFLRQSVFFLNTFFSSS